MRQSVSIVLAVLGSLSVFVAAANAESWSNLLAQARAADQLGAALTTANDRAAHEAEAMQRYLGDAPAASAKVAAMPAPSPTPVATPAPAPATAHPTSRPASNRLSYRELFDAAVLRAKKAGDAGDAGG